MTNKPVSNPVLPTNWSWVVVDSDIRDGMLTPEHEQEPMDVPSNNVIDSNSSRIEPIRVPRTKRQRDGGME